MLMPSVQSIAGGHHKEVSRCGISIYLIKKLPPRLDKMLFIV
jgi:hypothetical protein